MLITLSASLFLSLLIGSMGTDDQCVNTNSQTSVPYQLPTDHIDTYRLNTFFLLVN